MSCSRVVAACEPARRQESGRYDPDKVERKATQAEPWMAQQNHVMQGPASTWREQAAFEMVQGPPSACNREFRTTTAWRDAEFASWLEQKLAAERAAFVTKIEDKVKQHLTEHHRALFEEVSSHVGSALHDANTNTRVRATSSTTPPVLPPPCLVTVPKSPPTPDFNVKVSLKSACEEIEVKDSRGSEGGGAAQTRCSTVSRGGREASDYKSERMKSLAMAAMTEGGKRSTAFQRMVNSNGFEMVCCSLIIANVLVMALEVQYLGCTTGYNIRHHDCSMTADKMLPGADVAFAVTAVLFCIAFSTEFVLRALAMRWKALTSGWMWFDIVVLICGTADLIEKLSRIPIFGINPTMMRMVRVLRMLRMMKVLKSREGFSSLFLLVKSIQASKQALLWSLMILIFTMSCVGMLMNQLLLTYLEDPAVSPEDRREVYEFFGTYTRMIITMFELTLGNWAPPSRLLMEKISQWWGLFIVVYRCIFCFALVNVTNAVFITETNRVAASDDEVMMMRKERAKRANTSKLRDIFEELDESGDGSVGWDEFSVLLTDDVMRHFLETMDLEVTDLEELFRLLDDGDGQVQSREFIDGIQTLRGQAKNIDLLTLMKLTRTMSERMERVEKMIKDTK